MDRTDWRPAPGWENKYEVSRDGQVRRLKDNRICGQWTVLKGKILYRSIRLSEPRKIVPVHRLVAKAFVPNPHNKPTVNHIDCDGQNNCADNLEWVTQAENLAHAAALGRRRGHTKGKRSPWAKLSNETVSSIKEAYRRHEGSMQSLASRFGASKRTVFRIINEESYKDVQ